jgi:hypothetical protein
MDTILVVNAGSSSVKFQVFGTDGKGALDRLIKGQMDGIGTRPRLRAQAGDKALLVDQSYEPNEVGDVGSALVTAGAWLRDTQNLEPVAVGHRVVHSGPDYDRPVLIDSKVLTASNATCRWRRFISPTTSRRCVRFSLICPAFPKSPASTPRSTAATAPLRTIMRSPSASTRKACDAMVSMACPMNLLRAACRM